MRILRALLCGLVMLGVSGIDLAASLDSGTLTSQSAMARRHRKRRHHKKRRGRKHRKQGRSHHRSASPEL